MLKLLLKGDLTALSVGINELAPVLDIALEEGGYCFTVTQKAGADLSVTLQAQHGEIVYDRPCHFYRALGLAVEHIRDGEACFALSEAPQFNMNGPMFDMSQGNAAFNLKTLKQIIRLLALMGLDTLMLYCEDNFEVQNQPYFGYMRPRYTEAEMRELDDYAYHLGIEMIPCIQTLAHMPDGLRWKCYAPIRDYAECLLVGKQETYQFVRDLITSAARPFRTKKIHIGMDEAWNLGRGQYLTLNGYREPGEIMAEHLARVMEIVRELGLEPMMWDDMFFRAYNGGKYYVKDAHVPDEAINAVPEGMRCIYWDYYHRKHSDYEGFMPEHLRLCKNMVFAGGIWTWMGFALGWQKTLVTTKAALDTCKRLGVKDVFMTTWGDNGTECLGITNLIGCQLYAEHGYAEVFDYEKFKKRFAFCTGGCVEDFEKLDLLDRTPQNDALEDHSEYNASKYLMYQDILTGLCDKNIEGFEMDAHYRALADALKPAAARNGRFDGMFEFSYQVAHVLSLKAEMGLRITAAYRAGDRTALLAFAEQELPELSCRVKTLREIHMKNWFTLYKPFGWDIMDMRYGALLARIDSAVRELKAYLAGEMERIEELEEERLLYNSVEGPLRYLNFYGHFVSPSRIAPEA